jgi:hypothetical protein
MRWPESWAKADWAAKRLHEILFFSYVNGTTERGTGIDFYVKWWPPREVMILGQKNVAHWTLVDKTKIYLPPLHLKLELIKIRGVAIK